MSKAENPFLKGSRVWGGRWCDHCLDLGVRCYENGILLSDGRTGAVSVETGERTFAVLGKLDTCDIASGKVPQESGVAAIRQATKQIAQKAINEAISEAIKEAKNSVNFLDLNSNNWQG